MSMRLAEAVSRNASEALLLLATSGALLAGLRWRRALRRDFLLAFVVLLIGTGLAQIPVYLGGMTGWGPDLVLFAGLARWVQVLGAVLYMRAALNDYCGPWGWMIVTAFVGLVTWAI